jgi:hypothetical protein
MDDSGSSKLMNVFTAAKKMLLDELRSPPAPGTSSTVEAADRAAADRVFGHAFDSEAFANRSAPKGREAGNRGRLVQVPRRVTRSTGPVMQWADMTGAPVLAAGQQQAPDVPATFNDLVQTTALPGTSLLSQIDLEDDKEEEEESQELIRTGSPKESDRGIRSPVKVEGADLSSIKAPSPGSQKSPDRPLV